MDFDRTCGKSTEMIHTTSCGICFTRYGDRYDRITLTEGIFEPPLSLSLSLSRARARAHRREIIEKNYGTWISAKRHALPRRNFPAEVRRNEIRRAHVRARIAEISERGTSQACSRFIGARISSRNFQFSSKFTISVHGVPFIPPLACSIEN